MPIGCRGIMHADVRSLRGSAADQRRERNGNMRGKVGVNSLAVDPQRPHLFVTGGTDPLGAALTQNSSFHQDLHHPACTPLARHGGTCARLCLSLGSGGSAGRDCQCRWRPTYADARASERAVRLYDRRMAGVPGSSTATAWRAPMVAGFVPTHLKAQLLRPRPFGYSRCARVLWRHRRCPATLQLCRRCASSEHILMFWIPRCATLTHCGPKAYLGASAIAVLSTWYLWCFLIICAQSH